MCDTNETCNTSSTRLRSEVVRDRTTVVRGGVRKSDSTTPQLHDQQTCPHAQSYTQAPTTRTRGGALTFPSSCLDVEDHTGGSRSIPTEHPCCLWGGGCGLLTDHACTPPPRRMSPTTCHMKSQSFHFSCFSFFVVLLFPLSFCVVLLSFRVLGGAAFSPVFKVELLFPLSSAGWRCLVTCWMVFRYSSPFVWCCLPFTSFVRCLSVAEPKKAY